MFAQFFEYAVSDGEGTLLDHGVLSSLAQFVGLLATHGGKQMMLEPCSRMCPTGE